MVFYKSILLTQLKHGVALKYQTSILALSGVSFSYKLSTLTALAIISYKFKVMVLFSLSQLWPVKIHLK
jgi:hypothetical protein